MMVQTAAPTATVDNTNNGSGHPRHAHTGNHPSHQHHHPHLPAEVHLPGQETKLLTDLRRQIEFYFSPNNFSHDAYLQYYTMNYNAVPTTVIASFPKVRELLSHHPAGPHAMTPPADLLFLCRALESSDALAVSPDGVWISPTFLYAYSSISSGPEPPAAPVMGGPIIIPPDTPQQHLSSLSRQLNGSFGSVAGNNNNNEKDDMMAPSSPQDTATTDTSSQGTVEYIHHHQQQMMITAKERTTVLLRDLPDHCSEADVLHAFTTQAGGPPKSARCDRGTWYVTFVSEALALEALKESHDRLIAGFPIKARLKSELVLPSGHPAAPLAGPVPQPSQQQQYQQQVRPTTYGMALYPHAQQQHYYNYNNQYTYHDILHPYAGMPFGMAAVYPSMVPSQHYGNHPPMSNGEHHHHQRHMAPAATPHQTQTEFSTSEYPTQVEYNSHNNFHVNNINNNKNNNGRPVFHQNDSSNSFINDKPRGNRTFQKNNRNPQYQQEHYPIPPALQDGYARPFHPRNPTVDGSNGNDGEQTIPYQNSKRKNTKNKKKKTNSSNNINLNMAQNRNDGPGSSERRVGAEKEQPTLPSNKQQQDIETCSNGNIPQQQFNNNKTFKNKPFSRKAKQSMSSDNDKKTDTTYYKGDPKGPKVADRASPPPFGNAAAPSKILSDENFPALGGKDRKQQHKKQEGAAGRPAYAEAVKSTHVEAFKSTNTGGIENDFARMGFEEKKDDSW